MLTGRRDIARPAMKRGEHPTAERAAPRFTDWPNVARTGGACRFWHSVLVPALCADMARFPRFPRVFSWGNRCKARGCWWFPRFPRFHHQTSGTTANTSARVWLMAEPERVARDLHFREFSGNRGNRSGLALYVHHVGTRAECVDRVCPGLHHFPALLQVGGMVVGVAYFVGVTVR